MEMTENELSKQFDRFVEGVIIYLNNPTNGSITFVYKNLSFTFSRDKDGWLTIKTREDCPE